MKRDKMKLMKRFSALLAILMIFTLAPAAPLSVRAAAPAVSPLNVGPRGNTADDPANGIYVSPNGNDSKANGTIGAPYKSINAALAAAEPGDAVILRGGTYREGVNVRIRKPDITIKSRKGEWAVIDLTAFSSGHDEDSGVYFDVDSSGGKLQNVEVKGGFYAVCTETRWDWGNMANRAGASNIIIEDCILHDSRYDVVKIKPNCKNVTIRYNEIYNSGQAFAGRPQNGEDNAEGIDNVNGDNMIIQNNHIHDICSTAVYAKGGATDVLIENNLIERAHGAGIMVGFDTSPEYFNLAVNPHYYENIRGVVRNNLIIGTGWEGIGLYGSKDAVIHNNTLYNVANGGQYHSAIYFGLTYQDWEPYAGRPANVNPKIYNNIVSQPSGIVRPMVEIRYSGELGGMPALEGDPSMHNNCYYIAGKNAAFSDYRPGRLLENAGFTAWQAHIGGDGNSIEADPALGPAYMPGNPLCKGMGVSAGFIALPSMDNFRKSRTYRPGQFTDVDENQWYGYSNQQVLAIAYEYGLINGKSETMFDPSGNMTVAEAVALAAKVHSIYGRGQANFAQGELWYQIYIDYALANGIITANDFANPGRAATRAEMAYIFSRSLPVSEFPELNNVSSLPDVDRSAQYGEAIFMLYRAGVLSGNDAQGTFYPNNNMTRAEATGIITKVILPAKRTGGASFKP